jgi:hypothetical protein
VTKFNVGDRVRLSPQADLARRAALGDMEGTVKSTHAASGSVGVDWDVPTPRWDGPERDEIELVPAPQAINVGDRVRVVADTYPARAPRGTVGTVTSPLDGDGYLEVDIPGWHSDVSFTAQEVELITPAAPLVDNPAALRLRADEIDRNVVEDVKATAESLRLIEKQRKEIARKRTLASQYRAVANDLEANS